MQVSLVKRFGEYIDSILSTGLSKIIGESRSTYQIDDFIWEYSVFLILKQFIAGNSS